MAVSGYTSPADVQRALDAGLDRVCGKPVKFTDISQAVSSFSGERARFRTAELTSPACGQ